MEKMLNERRQWVNDQRGKNLGKPPEDIKPGFYDRLNVETPLSPEEEAAKKAEDEEGGGKKKKEKKKAEKKKGKGKKGKDDDDGKP